MVTLTDRNQLLARHQSRFANVLDQAEREMQAAASDLHDESVRLNSGAGGQPQGASRVPWLTEIRPFAVSAPAGFAVNPVGFITGKLRDSIQVDFSNSGHIFHAVSYSNGVDYAKFVWAWSGTKFMVPRLVRQNAQAWAIMRMKQVDNVIMAYQRSLF